MLYIGDSEKAVEYFAKLSFKCPDLARSADFFMDVTSVDRRSEVAERNSRDRLHLFASKCEEGVGRKCGEIGGLNEFILVDGSGSSKDSKDRTKNRKDDELMSEYQGREARIGFSNSCY